MRLESGRQLGHYKIVSTLGKGGMGEVYRATDLRLGRDVAIKVLPEALAEDEDLLSRFEKEAKALAALAHPNILTIFDFGNDSGIAYAVTEILEGESLRSRMLRSRLPWRQVVEISAAIAEGMAAAHSKGIIHRDLKPENIFLTSDGRIKILDFGLVHWHPGLSAEGISYASTQMPKTEATRILGTLPYMSPEQLNGSAVDARSDIFSFGCILYEILSGKHPFMGKTFTETTAAILKDEPSKPSLHETDTPPSLERVLFRCLNKNPDNRYHSAKDLAYDLATLRSDAFIPTPVPSQAVSTPKKFTGWYQIFFAIVTVCVLAAGIWWLQTRSVSTEKVGKSIAVLPFSNMTDDKEDEYFSDGITEDIITHLSKVSDLKVVSRTSSMRYKNTAKSLQEISKELRVTAVLEGSVRRQGSRLRIVAQLIDAQTDNHIWAETYDREMKDVFAIQSDVAQKIAAALQARLLPEERKKIEQIPTQNITAYDYYLKGRQYYLRYEKEQNESAIQLFQKAIDVDPNFTLAYVGLCDSYSMRPNYGVPGASLDLAIDTCNKALSINPNLAIAHATIYKAYRWKGLSEKAEQALHKAYELDPNDPVVVGRLASDHLNKGRLEEAFRFGKRELELDPTNPFPYFTMGVIHYALADFEQAENFLIKGLELQPDLAFPAFWLTIVYLSQGKSEEALAVVNKLKSIKPEEADRVLGFVESVLGNYSKAIEHFRKSGRPTNHRYAHALYQVGQNAEAQKILEEADRKNREELNTGDLDPQYVLACIHAIRGEKKEALKQLQKACDLGYHSYAFIEKDPIFEEMRTDPQYQQIIEKMKSNVAEIRRRIGI